VRTGKQCRERWLNQLSPEVRKDSWTEEEDRIILDAHSRLGNKWVAISKLLEGRPANAVKNRWNSTLHRRFSNGSDMGSPYSPSDSPDSSFRKRKRAKRPVRTFLETVGSSLDLEGFLRELTTVLFCLQNTRVVMMMMTMMTPYKRRNLHYRIDPKSLPRLLRQAETEECPHPCGR
jgi:hypothetical protein